MEQSLRLWTIGGFSIAFSIGSIILNVLLGCSISDVVDLSALRTLLFVSVGLNVVALCGLIYFNAVPIRQLRAASLGLSRTSWWIFVYGTAVAASALILTGVVLVWSTLKQEDLPRNTIHERPIILIAIWFAAWGVTLPLC